MQTDYTNPLMLILHVIVINALLSTTNFNKQKNMFLKQTAKINFFKTYFLFPSDKENQ